MKNLNKKMILNIGLESGTRFKNKLTEEKTMHTVLNFLNNNNLKYTYKIERSKSENTLIVYLEKVLENPQVIKTPVVRNGKQSTFGYQPDIWKGWN